MTYLYTYYTCSLSTGLWVRKPEVARDKDRREPARLLDNIAFPDQDTDRLQVQGCIYSRSRRPDHKITTQCGENCHQLQAEALHAVWFGWEMLYYFRETSNFIQDYMAMVENTNLWLEKKGRKLFLGFDKMKEQAMPQTCSPLPQRQCSRGWGQHSPYNQDPKWEDNPRQ